MVSASKYAVVTQAMWSNPPRSPAMVGSAVATMVASSAATNMTSIRPEKTTASLRPCSSRGTCSSGTHASQPPSAVPTARSFGGCHLINSLATEGKLRTARERPMSAGRRVVARHADQLCRYASDDGVGRHVLGHDRTGAYDRAVANRHAGY